MQHLTVTILSGGSPADQVAIKTLSWTGLRCKVTIEGFVEGLRLDIRTHPGNAATSVAVGDKPFKEDGVASIVVKDDSLEGHEATIVVLDATGHLMGERITIIGKREA